MTGTPTSINSVGLHGTASCPAPCTQVADAKRVKAVSVAEILVGIITVHDMVESNSERNENVLRPDDDGVNVGGEVATVGTAVAVGSIGDSTGDGVSSGPASQASGETVKTPSSST